MAGSSASLVVRISADLNDFSRGLDKATRDVDKAAKKIEGFGKALTLGITVPVAAAAVALAKMAAESRFFGAENQGQALMIAMAGRDLGFSYTQALRAFHNIKGKMSLSADGMVAACLQHPNICEYFHPVEMTDARCTWETKRVGMAEPIRYSFSMEDAQRAGIANDMYRKHPRRMLSARAKSYLARDVYPELLMGLVEDDEAREIAAPRAESRPVSVVASVVEVLGPRNTPPEPDAYESPAAVLAARLNAATNPRELAAVAADVKRASIDDAERSFLRDLYSERQKALRPAPVVAAEQDAAPEPGSEG